MHFSSESEKWQLWKYLRQAYSVQGRRVYNGLHVLKDKKNLKQLEDNSNVFHLCYDEDNILSTIHKFSLFISIHL